jgi:hypothetical protein
LTVFAEAQTRACAHIHARGPNTAHTGHASNTNKPLAQCNTNSARQNTQRTCCTAASAGSWRPPVSRSRVSSTKTSSSPGLLTLLAPPPPSAFLLCCCVCWCGAVCKGEETCACACVRSSGRKQAAGAVGERLANICVSHTAATHPSLLLLSVCLHKATNYICLAFG